MKKTAPPLRLTLFRILLILLILLNMTMIIGFSRADGDTSSESSKKVTTYIAQTTVPDFEKQPVKVQNKIINTMDFPVRKIAHMLEFGALASLMLILLLTWRGHYFIRWGISILYGFCFALCDEGVQRLSAGRNPSMEDVWIDTAGAFLCTGLVLLCFFLFCQKKIVAETEVDLNRASLLDHTPNDPISFLLVTDMHNQHYEKVLRHIRETHPDAVLIVGDLCEYEKDGESGEVYAFLREATSLAPTFYSLGNHEVRCHHKGNLWRKPVPVPLSPETVEKIRDTGVTFLEEGESTVFEGFTLCALGTGINGKSNKPNEQALAHFATLPSPRILLCHHPEYYVPYIKATGIEWTVSGHAHGGQWRPFGKAIYSPGQGIFPKYTAGVLDGRCLISRGVGNHSFIPRLFNRPEVILFSLERTDS